MPALPKSATSSRRSRGRRSEVVLVGAHFDSWDPGQGAQDDGVGVAAVLEAARILKSLGIKPRRTIRFVFFSGEEQALLGSRAYVETTPPTNSMACARR